MLKILKPYFIVTHDDSVLAATSHILSFEYIPFDSTHMGEIIEDSSFNPFLLLVSF